MRLTLMIGGLLVMAAPLAARQSPAIDAAPPGATLPDAVQDGAIPDAAAAAASSDFAAYDTDRSGQLDKSEFTSWYLAAKQAQLSADGEGASQAALTGQVQLAFNTADADKNQTVSQEELSRFLEG